MKPSPDTSLPDDITDKDIESRGRKLSAKLLLLPKTPETGGDILKGQGQLIRMKNLEGGTIWLAPTDLITPNPEQPREYFDPAKMEELKKSIKEHGQEVAVKAVPYLDKKTNQIKLFLIDGERRLRAVRTLELEHIRMEVAWKASEEEIFETSLLLNEAREGHNPIEKARAYERMIRYYCKGEKRVKTKAIQKLADKLGLSYATINNYLRLLEFDSSIQQMVAEGTLPTYAVLQIASAKKKFGDKLNEAKVAALLLQDMNRDFQEDGEGGEVKKSATIENVRRAIQRALVTGGVSKTRAEALEAAHRTINFVTELGRLGNACEAVLALQLRDAVITHMQERGGASQPPEVLMERIQDLIDKLRTVYQEIIKPVITPPLVIPKGAPKFAEYIAGMDKKRFTHPHHYAITCILADASDDEGKLMTTDNISAELKKRFSVSIESVALGSTMQAISRSLPEALRLDARPIRRRSQPRGDMVIITGYRLAWKDGVTFSPSDTEEKPNAQPSAKPATPAPKPPVVPSRPAEAAKPAVPAPRPPVKPATPLPGPPKRSDLGLSARDLRRSRIEAVPRPRPPRSEPAPITLPDMEEVKKRKGSFTIKAAPEGLESVANQIGTILANARMKLKPSATMLEIRIEEREGRRFIIKSNIRNFQINGLSYRRQFQMAIAMARNITTKISEANPATDAAENKINELGAGMSAADEQKPKTRFAPELVNVQLMDM